LPNDLMRRLRTQNPLGSPAEVRICHEAGPTDYRLVRRLRELGGHCQVVAPAKTPKRVSVATVAKCVVRHRRVDAGQSWKTFLQDHMAGTACDFIVVPTLTFNILYGFVVQSHDRRRMLHINVTAHPTAEWAAQQLTEACPNDTMPRYLLQDREANYGWAFQLRLKALGMEQLVIGRRFPWLNPYAERVIGSIRRECLDHTSRSVNGTC